MDAFPAFYPLTGARVVIAGDGEPAEAKARLFADTPADLVRIEGAAALTPESYAGAALIFVASWDRDFVERAAAVARTASAPVNVVDRPELSDFHTPAILDRGSIVAAIGTGGAAPLMASLMRAELERVIPTGIGALAGLFGRRREALRAAFGDLPLRRAFLRAVLAGPIGAMAAVGRLAEAEAALDAAIAAGWSAVGRIAVLPPPAAPDLISIRAARFLNVADIVVSGPSGQAVVAAHARRDAAHQSWETVIADALLDELRRGRLIAILPEAEVPELIEALTEGGYTPEPLLSAAGP